MKYIDFAISFVLAWGCAFILSLFVLLPLANSQVLALSILLFFLAFALFINLKINSLKL